MAFTQMRAAAKKNTTDTALRLQTGFVKIKGKLIFCVYSFLDTVLMQEWKQEYTT